MWQCQTGGEKPPPAAGLTGDATQAGEVAGIILASGMSRRLGGANKLLLPVAGEPLVRRVAAAYLGAGLKPVLAVVGHQAGDVGEALRGLDIEIAQNPNYKEGQSRALVRGVAALPATAVGAVIGVGDQPYLSAEIIVCLLAKFRSEPVPVVAPRYGGRRGNPALFASSLFAELMAVEGDRGGRGVLEAHAAEVAWVDFEDPRPAIDVDTIEEYRALFRTEV
jgi:molybdenum cofactor cytidylyltransferase